MDMPLTAAKSNMQRCIRGRQRHGKRSEIHCLQFVLMCDNIYSSTLTRKSWCLRTLCTHDVYSL